MKSFQELKAFLLESKPKRIGKNTPDAFYVHKNYEYDTFDKDALDKAKSYLPKDYDYQITKRDHKSGEFSFLQSHDFDTATEPTVGNSLRVKSNGELKLKPINKDPENQQIYHRKEKFVGPDYKGFDIEKAKQRTDTWTKVADEVKKEIPNIYRIIGTRKIWKEHILSKLNEEFENTFNSHKDDHLKSLD